MSLLTIRRGEDHDAIARRQEGDDPEPVRLVTRMHMPRSTCPAAFRLIAVLLCGRRRLVCLGATPREARKHARENREMIPPSTINLIVERWVGTRWNGRWEQA